MDDLLGLGKGTEKLLSTVERAIGGAYRTLGARREARIEAYAIDTLEAARTKAKARDLIEQAKAQATVVAMQAEASEALEERLNKRLRHQALEQQRNIEQIVAGAFDQAPPVPNDDEVEREWLHNFFDRAQNVSGEQMQGLWSRVLSLEVGRPGTFSIRSLDVLRKMTRREAGLFQVACRLASAYGDEKTRTRIVHGAERSSWLPLGFGFKLELSEVGLGVLDRVTLSQLSLMYEDGLVYSRIPAHENLELRFASTRLHLRARWPGVALETHTLTPVGAELSALLSPEEDARHVAALAAKLPKYFHVLNDAG